MFRLAARAGMAQGVRNVTWALGADSDLPTLGALVGPESLAMTVIGQALHWMRHEQGFRALVPMSAQEEVSPWCPTAHRYGCRTPPGREARTATPRAASSERTMRQSGGESGSRAMPWSVNRDP